MPWENLKQIALRIKTLREIAHISTEDLAKEFGIEKEIYEGYESADIDIPVSFLYEVAKKFKVELTALITGEEPRLHSYIVVKKGRGLSTERRKEYKYQDLGYNFINKKMEAFLVEIEPSDNLQKNSYCHPGQEFTYVLEGVLKVFIDKNEVILEEGDALYFDSGKKHCMRALNNKKAKFLAVII